MITKKAPKLEEGYGEIDNVAPSVEKRPATCNYCKFQFKANYATKTPKNCPYCGRRFFMDD
jgi:predicted Zn-ribbon and HTH transcriptional regulator